MVEKTGRIDIGSDARQRLGIIKRNSAELIGEDELVKKLESGKDLSAYIGRATTGPLHLGHVISISKMLDLQKAGIKSVLLLADIHAALDDQKARWDELDKRVEYTKKCIELSFDWPEPPKFARGSDFQLGRNYVLDALKISSSNTVERTMRAASEVTRMKNPKVSELIYPIFQALDEQYLGVDMQVGGLDQRHILVFAREVLPTLGYEKRVELMMPLVTSIQGPGVKMSSSLPDSVIKVYDSEGTIRKKINGAYCPVGVAKENFVLQLAQFVIFADSDSLAISRDARFGGDVKFDSYAQLEFDFLNNKLHPMDLKRAVADHLVKKFERVRTYFGDNPDLLKELGPRFIPS